jgi:hypothetical protein
VAIKLQIRRGVAADWANPSNNPTLLVGEIGLETDTGNFKIGTGALAWNSLPYASVTYPQVSGAGTDLNATAYRAQGRYEVGVSVVTNVPSDWTPASDAPGILLVTRIATGSIAQVLFSTKTQKVFCRAWDGTTYTTWVSLSNQADSVGTTQIVNLAVTTAKIDDNAVTNGKLRDSAALSVIGRNANSSGDPADIAATAASGAVLRESGSTIGFGTIATAGIADDAVTYAKIQNVTATDRVLGRSTAGAGDIEEITCTAAGRALLDDADAAAQRTTLGVPSLASMQTYAGVGSLVIAGQYQTFATSVQAGTTITQPASVTTAGSKLMSGSGLVFHYSGTSLSGGSFSLLGGSGSVWRCIGLAQPTETMTDGTINLFIRIS